MERPLNQCHARLQCILIQYQKYDFQLKYKRGKELIIADALLRAYANENSENDEWDKELQAQVNLITSQNEIQDILLEKI